MGTLWGTPLILNPSGNNYVVVGSTNVTFGRFSVHGSGTTYTPVAMHDTDSAAGTTMLCNIVRNGASVGSIGTSLTATQFNTSSDYRLKVLLGDGRADAVKRVMRWNVHKGYFKAEPELIVNFFVAHELQEVNPTAVTGQKDAMRALVNYDSSGIETGRETVPDYQSVDHSKLIPDIAAALQCALERIAALEDKLS